MSQTIVTTKYNFPGQKDVYHGKVREVYKIDDDYLMMIVSDRISAFDVVLPKGIPYKGQVLNQIAEKFLDATSDIVPNWKIDSPDPNVTFGHRCDTYPVEMIVRAYLTGSSWRTSSWPGSAMARNHYPPPPSVVRTMVPRPPTAVPVFASTNDTPER